MVLLAEILAAYIVMRGIVAITGLVLLTVLLVGSSVYSARRSKEAVAYWLTAILGGLGLCFVVRVVGYSGDPKPDDLVGFIYDWLGSWPVVLGFWGSIVCVFMARSDQANARASSGVSWAFLMAAAYSFYLYRH